MNPPPLPPDDQPPPLPTGPDPKSNPPAGRDPLLDDPHFAEIVLGRDEKKGEPAFAEDVEDPVEGEPAVAEVVSKSPPPSAADLPRAYPVQPPAPPTPAAPVRSEPVRPAAPSAAPFPQRRPDSAPPPSTPRPRILGACCVIGCLGVLLLASVGFLAFVAITVLGQLSDEIEDRDRRRVQNLVAMTRPEPIAPPEVIPANPIKLPGRFDTVGRAAGGRFLLLKIPSTRQLAIFDPNHATVTYLDIDEPDALFAGGAAKLYLYKPKARTLERWNLVTRTLEFRQKQPADLPAVTAMAVGAASDGLVYLFSIGERGSTLTVVEPVELKPRHTHKLPELRSSGRPFVRTSDDGSVIAVSWEHGASVFKYEGEDIRPLTLWRAGRLSPSLATPSPDGKYIYTPRGVFATDRTNQPVPDSKYFYTLPTAHGSGLYLSLPVVGDKITGSPRVHAAGSTDVLATLDDLRTESGGAMFASESSSDVAPDQRVHLWPAAGLVAFLPRLNSSSIELVKIDIGEALRKSGEEHLVIGSDPPTTAVVGEEWAYRPEIWSLPPRGTELRLRERPSEMRIRGGDIVWTPSAAGSFDVVLVATDSANQRSTEQRFRVVAVNPEEEEDH